MSETVVLLMIAGGLLYFMPAFVAFGRSHHQAKAILVLTIFLGWTFLGWVGALVWSMTAVRRDASTSPSSMPPAA